MSKSYDPKCEELARYFLPDGSSLRLIVGLSLRIQESVEEWLEEEQHISQQALQALKRVVEPIEKK